MVMSRGYRITMYYYHSSQSILIPSLPLRYKLAAAYEKTVNLQGRGGSKTFGEMHVY